MPAPECLAVAAIKASPSDGDNRDGECLAAGKLRSDIVRRKLMTVKVINDDVSVDQLHPIAARIRSTVLLDGLGPHKLPRPEGCHHGLPTSQRFPSVCLIK